MTNGRAWWQVLVAASIGAALTAAAAAMIGDAAPREILAAAFGAAGTTATAYALKSPFGNK